MHYTYVAQETDGNIGPTWYLFKRPKYIGRQTSRRFYATQVGLANMHICRTDRASK